MNQATKARAIELQEISAHWYQEARRTVSWAEANEDDYWFAMDQRIIARREQGYAAHYAAKARAILCDD